MRRGFFRAMMNSGGSSFSPTDLSGLQLWIDASDFVSAGAISQWNDKSGLNNHLLQPTGANQPSVVLTQKNSKPIVRFNVLSFMELTSSIASNTDRTDFFLIKKNAGDNVCSLSDGSGMLSIFLFTNIFYTVTPTTYQQANTVLANYDVIMHTRTGNTMVLYKNGVVLSSSNFGGSYPNNPFLYFGRHSVGITSIFDCAEHIFYNRVLTTQELADIQTYLATKWAL